MPDKLYRNLQMHRRGTSLQLQMRGTSLQKVLKEVLIVPPCKRSSWTRSARANDSARKLASACSTSATRCSLFTARAVVHTYVHIYIYL